MPLKDGGSNKPSNLVTLCKECHQATHGGPATAPSANSANEGEFVEDVLLLFFTYLYLVSEDERIAYASIGIYVVGIVAALTIGSMLYAIIFLGGGAANLWIHKYGDFPEPERGNL